MVTLAWLRDSAAIGPFTAMIAITITPEAYEAILLGTAKVPSPQRQDGLITVWLDCTFVDRIGHLRGPGETYSEVILRLAKAS